MHNLVPLILKFGVDVLRLCVWLVLLVLIFVPLERLFGERPAKFLRPQLGNDLCYYFISSLLPAILLALPLAVLTTAVGMILPPAYLRMIGNLPLWVTLPAALIVADTGSYWGHRLSHEIPLLWRFHAVHHSPEHLDFLVNGRAHPLDLVWVRLWGLAPIYLLGLGHAGMKGSIVPVVVTLIGTFASFFVHANLRLRFGPLEWLFVTPAFHHWHHTRKDHINRNYSATFPWIDRIFGTFYLPNHFPHEYGISEKMPATLVGQLTRPFLRRAKVKTHATTVGTVAKATKSVGLSEE